MASDRHAVWWCLIGSADHRRSSRQTDLANFHTFYKEEDFAWELLHFYWRKGLCAARDRCYCTSIRHNLCHNITRIKSAIRRRIRSPPGAAGGATASGVSGRDATGRHSVATLGSRVPRTRSVTPAAGPRSARLSWFVRGVVLVNIHSPGTVASARPAPGGTAHGPRALAATTRDATATRGPPARERSRSGLSPRDRVSPPHVVTLMAEQGNPLDDLSVRPASPARVLNARPHDLKHCMPGYPPRHVSAVERRWLLTYLTLALMT